ncbi:MAG: protein kinase domain-containing protein [Planctomycetota bacterium]
MSGGGDFDRLERALEVFAAWEADGMPVSGAALLAAHEDLREVLEPLVADATGEVDEPEPDPQLEIDGFRIEYELGRGGMGVVYAARQVALDRTVALKVLPADGRVEPRAVARFRRESSLLASLDHPSLVEVLTVGRDRGCEYFAMEMVDGVPLNRVLRELGAAGSGVLDGSSVGSTVDGLLARAVTRRPKTATAATASGSTQRSRSHFDEAARIVWQIADALAHAHDAGVLHRDVKPSNILLRRDGRAVLTDFGLAREVGRPSMTQSGEFAGTAYYAAPEQVLGRSRDLDGRVDVFALGVVLYELLTLHRPFEGANSHEVAQAVLRDEPVDPSVHNRRVPSDLAAIALRALEKEPRRRYRTAREMADDLDAFLHHRPVRARRAGPLRRLQRYVRREPWKAALALVVLVSVPSIAFLSGYLQARAPLVAAGEQELARRRVDELLERATMLLELGDDGAALALDEALALDPADPDTIGMLVWARCDRGDGMSLDELDALLAGSQLAAAERARLRASVLQRLGRGDEARAVLADLEPAGSAVAAFYAGLAALTRGHATGERAAFGAAADAFEMAVLLAPRRRPLYLNKLAHALGHAGDDDRRAAVAAALHRAWPDSVSQQYWSYFAEKDSARSRARERLQRAIALRSGSGTLHYNLGTSYLRSGLPREAIPALERAIEIAPDYAPAHGNLAKARFQTQDLEGAIAAIDAALAREPDNALFVANRGQFLLAQGRTDDAVAAHDRALAIDPAQPIALAGKAYVLYTTRGAEPCRAFCEQHLEAGHVSEELYRYLVMSLTTLGRHQDAIAAADRGIERFGRSAWLHLRRAYAARPVDHAVAVASARRATELAPGHPLMHEALAKMLLDGRPGPTDCEHAARAYTRQAELSPKNGPAHLNAAISWMRAGRPGDAVACMRTATVEVPGWGPGHENLGGLLLDLGRVDDAILALQHGCEVVPDHAGVRFRLAFALHRRASVRGGEQPDATRADVERALALLEGREDAESQRLRAELEGMRGGER